MLPARSRLQGSLQASLQMKKRSKTTDPESLALSLASPPPARHKPPPVLSSMQQASILQRISPSVLREDVPAQGGHWQSLKEHDEKQPEQAGSLELVETLLLLEIAVRFSWMAPQIGLTWVEFPSHPSKCPEAGFADSDPGMSLQMGVA